MINKYEFHRIFYNNTNYIYDINNASLYELDDISNSILELYNIVSKEEIIERLKNQYEESDIIEGYINIREIHKDGLERIEELKRNQQDRGWSIDSLSFILTEQCNLQCKYCYVSENNIDVKDVMYKNMNVEIAKKSVDFLLSNSIAETCLIIFFGGEPLLNKELINIIIEYANEVKDLYGKKVKFSITTNATLLSEETKKILLDNNVKFHISIDGDKSTHDNMRQYKNQQGTFEDIINNIANIPSVSKFARGTVTNKNIDLISLLKSVQEVGFARAHFELVSSDNKDMRLDEDSLKEFMRQYSELCNHTIENLKDKSFIKYQQIFDDVNKIREQTFVPYECKGAKAYFSVDYKGDLYPCHRFVGLEKYSLGNIFDGIDIDKQTPFINADIFNKKQCQDCWIKFLCGGGCYHESVIYNDDLLVPFNNKCDMKRHAIEEAIKLHIKLMNNEELMNEFLQK